MVEVNKFKLGLFITGGFVLLLTVLFILGGSDLFVSKVPVVTLFSESVQGLEVGSAVKYKGVPIGRIRAINIQMHDKMIRVDMEIDENAFIAAPKYFGGRKESINNFYVFFEEQPKNGLKIRMDYAGITGFKYLEMNYYDQKPDNLIPRPKTLPDSTLYIQALPSIFTDVLNNITTSLDNIAKINFNEISGNLENSINKINAILNDKSIAATLSNIESISHNLNITSDSLSTISKERITEVIDATVKAIHQFDALALKLNEEAATAGFAQTNQSVRQASTSVSDAGVSLENTLAKLNRTVDALTSLLQLLNDNPNALVRGKAAAPVTLPHQE